MTHWEYPAIHSHHSRPSWLGEVKWPGPLEFAAPSAQDLVTWPGENREMLRSAAVFDRCLLRYPFAQPANDAKCGRSKHEKLRYGFKMVQTCSNMRSRQEQFFKMTCNILQYKVSDFVYQSVTYTRVSQSVLHIPRSYPADYPWDPLKLGRNWWPSNGIHTDSMCFSQFLIFYLWLLAKMIPADSLESPSWEVTMIIGIIPRHCWVNLWKESLVPLPSPYLDMTCPHWSRISPAQDFFEVGLFHHELTDKARLICGTASCLSSNNPKTNGFRPLLVGGVWLMYV